MKNKFIYFGLLILIILIYILASNYRQSPPLYYVQKYNFENEQKQILNITQEDIGILDSIRHARQISMMDTIIYTIRDSLLETHITDRKRYLANQNLDNYVLESKRDSLVILKQPQSVEFINDIIQTEYIEQLPKKYDKYYSKNYNYSFGLFFKQDDLPIDVSSLKWSKDQKYYFITNQNFKSGITIRKLDELYSSDEILEKGLFGTNTITVPDEVLFPYSNSKLWLIPIFILVAIFPGLMSAQKTIFPKKKREYNNSQRTVAIFWFILIFVFLFVILSVFIFEIDIYHGGGAMIFVGFFLFVISIILFLIYLKRARQFDKVYQNIPTDDDIKNTQTLNIKWTYDKAYWDNFASLHQREKLDSNKSMFIFVAVMIIIVFGIFMIADPEAAPAMGYIGLGLLILLFVVSRLTPKLSAERLKNSKPECIITNSALILGKQYHNWMTLGNKLESVKFIKDNKPRLEIIYSYPVRYGRQNYTILVPVPSDQFDTAEKVAEILTKEIK